MAVDGTLNAVKLIVSHSVSTTWYLFGVLRGAFHKVYARCSWERFARYFEMNGNGAEECHCTSEDEEEDESEEEEDKEPQGHAGDVRRQNELHVKTEEPVIRKDEIKEPPPPSPHHVSTANLPAKAECCSLCHDRQCIYCSLCQKGTAAKEMNDMPSLEPPTPTPAPAAAAADVKEEKKEEEPKTDKNAPDIDDRTIGQDNVGPLGGEKVPTSWIFDTPFAPTLDKMTPDQRLIWRDDEGVEPAHALSGVGHLGFAFNARHRETYQD